MNHRSVATQIITKLSVGTPPQRGVALYAVGNERLLDGIKRYHLSGIEERGIIRFISGSWGAGKTHLFRLLREQAFENDCLVANVELSRNETPLNKFERVFYTIVRNIETPSLYHDATGVHEAAPFGQVVRESLYYLSTGRHKMESDVSYDDYTHATEALMSNRGIDIDFKKMIQEYWKTFLPDGGDVATIEQARSEILQWFSGEGAVGIYRKRFGVTKIVSKENAKLMLQSLAGFIQLAGYRGLLILFDEAEANYSGMRESDLKNAHNNLLSLINNIEALAGLFLIYATTPDFYNDPRHGIRSNGPLFGRIGQPEQRKPRALDVIWNLDEVETDLSTYQEAARKIKDLYAIAYPEAESELPSEVQLRIWVRDMLDRHPRFQSMRFWRVLTTGLVEHFNDCAEGEIRPTEDLYEDVMAKLGEE